MSAKSQKKILIIEDEKEIRELLALHMVRNGFATHLASNGEETKQEITKFLKDQVVFDLVLIDWMLPDTSGIDLIQEFRSKPQLKNIPIVMLTAKAESENIVRALEAGADDYIIKPFDAKVLVARINSLFRRASLIEEAKKNGTTLEGVNSSSGIKNKELVCGPIKMNLLSHEAWCENELLALTPSEFKILQSLVFNAGCVLTREQLIQEVQGDGVNVIGRTIDTHTFALRKKLGTHAECIETIRGVGYRFRE